MLGARESAMEYVTDQCIVIGIECTVVFTETFMIRINLPELVCFI